MNNDDFESNELIEDIINNFSIRICNIYINKRGEEIKNVMLNRKNTSACILSGKVHDNENAKLMVKNNIISFSCFRGCCIEHTNLSVFKDISKQNYQGNKYGIIYNYDEEKEDKEDSDEEEEDSEEEEEEDEEEEDKKTKVINRRIEKDIENKRLMDELKTDVYNTLTVEIDNDIYIEDLIDDELKNCNLNEVTYFMSNGSYFDKNLNIGIDMEDIDLSLGVEEKDNELNYMGIMLDNDINLDDDNSWDDIDDFININVKKETDKELLKIDDKLFEKMKKEPHRIYKTIKYLWKCSPESVFKTNKNILGEKGYVLDQIWLDYCDDNKVCPVCGKYDNKCKCLL